MSDLDALEREWETAFRQGKRIAEMDWFGLIQRLREADRALTEMAETFGGQASRIERYEEARIVELERVREAAQRIDDQPATIWLAGGDDEPIRRTGALADLHVALEELRLTKTPTSHKAGSA